MSVYIETYAFTNAAMDFFLLSLCALICGRRLKKWGTAAACILGAVYSVAAYSGFWPVQLNFPLKLMITALMVFLAFGKTRTKAFFKLFAGFFTASFAAGGTGFGISYLLGAGGFGYSGFIISAAVCTGGFYLILWQKRARRLSKWRLPVCVAYEGGEMALTAFIDSGNSLTEPMSALPVAVCFDERVTKILPPAGLSAKYSSVGGPGEFCLYTPKALYSLEGGKRKRLGDIYIAFSPVPGQTGIDLLLPPCALEA